jgi:ABC-type transport system involved in multi-copper enzyme maturation permease subunit
VTGLLRADLLRFRRRPAVLVTLVVVPAFAAFVFLAGFRSLESSEPAFDESAFRQQLIDEGFGAGMTSDELAAQLDEIVAEQRAMNDQIRAQQDEVARSYTFPASLVTVLTGGNVVFFAVLLLAATTLGDEFSWGTIRMALVASPDRRRWLLARLTSLAAIALALLTVLALLGTALPSLLAATGATLPTSSVDPGALSLLVLADVVTSIALIGFATFLTLVLRSGALTLVVVLVYALAEMALQGALTRIDAFAEGGALAPLTDVLPARAVVHVLDVASRVALGPNPYEPLLPELAVALVPLVAIVGWASLFIVGAFVRLDRMDIVE